MRTVIGEIILRPVDGYRMRNYRYVKRSRNIAVIGRCYSVMHGVIGVITILAAQNIFQQNIFIVYAVVISSVETESPCGFLIVYGRCTVFCCNPMRFAVVFRSVLPAVSTHAYICDFRRCNIESIYRLAGIYAIVLVVRFYSNSVSSHIGRHNIFT